MTESVIWLRRSMTLASLGTLAYLLRIPFTDARMQEKQLSFQTDEVCILLLKEYVKMFSGHIQIQSILDS